MFGFLQNVVNQGPDNGLGYTTIGSIFGVAMNVAIGVGISLSMLSLGFAGILYITSSGDPKATETAFNGIKYAVIALVLSLGALTVKAIVLNLIGAEGPDLVNAVPGF